MNHEKIRRQGLIIGSLHMDLSRSIHNDYSYFNEEELIRFKEIFDTNSKELIKDIGIWKTEVLMYLDGKIEEKRNLNE